MTSPSASTCDFQVFSVKAVAGLDRLGSLRLQGRRGGREHLLGELALRLQQLLGEGEARLDELLRGGKLLREGHGGNRGVGLLDGLGAGTAGVGDARLA